jgi:hypothetical protein
MDKAEKQYYEKRKKSKSFYKNAIKVKCIGDVCSTSGTGF